MKKILDALFIWFIQKLIRLYISKKRSIDIGVISDGYHSFNELYTYRMIYNAVASNLLASKFEVYKSKKHSDNKLCFGGGWFVVVMELPTGQVTNHYPLSEWDFFKIPERPRAGKYDGHSPTSAKYRLFSFAENQKL